MPSRDLACCNEHEQGLATSRSSPCIEHEEEPTAVLLAVADQLLEEKSLDVFQEIPNRMKRRRVAGIVAVSASAFLLCLCGTAWILSRGRHDEKTAHSISEIGLPYDCEAGLANSQAGWSAEKTQWCCHTFSKGCPSSLLPEGEEYHTLRSHQQDDRDRVYASATHQSDMRNIYEGVDGSRMPAQPQVRYAHRFESSRQQASSNDLQSPFDCNADFQNWQDQWSTSKQKWCCRTYQRGCAMEHGQTSVYHRPARVEDVPYDRMQTASRMRFDATHHGHAAAWNENCDAMDASSVGSWSIEQRQHCCQQHGRGCSAEQFPWAAWRLIVGGFVIIFACIAACVCYRECSRQGEQTTYTQNKAPYKDDATPTSTGGQVRQWYH